MVIEEGIKRLGRRAGIEISRYRPFAARRDRHLLETGIATVIDVGANTGEYGAGLRASGFDGRIISLEPLTSAFALLARRAKMDDAWECHNVAVGASDGEAIINVASNLASSSLLPMRAEHRVGAPEVTYVGHERVQLRRLDALALGVEGPALLKVDVQGYEQQVLAGAANTLRTVLLIECEVSIAPLYAGQPSFRQMIAGLADLGFEMSDIDPFFYDRSDGRVLSVDAMFSRTQPLIRDTAGHGSGGRSC